MQVPEVFFYNPNNLTAHPLLASIPMLDEGSPEFQGMLTSIRDRGIDYPVILDRSHRIIDGRNRARAAAICGAELPCIQRPDNEASEIILSSILNRRHLPKGALAYLSAPLFTPAVEAGRARKIANLSGGSRKPTELAIGKTVQQLAAEMGFSDELYRQAVRVRELFEKTEKKVWKDGGRPVEATFRGWFEPKILSGEIGLGGVIQAIAGKEATDGLTKKTRDLPTLFARAFGDLKARFGRWESLAVDQRRTVAKDIAREAAEWPEDVRQQVLSSLEKAAAHPARKPGF